MPGPRLLLLSNSSNAGEPYLEYALPAITAFLGSTPRNVALIPFAAVRRSYDLYAATVSERLHGTGHPVRSVHDAADPAATIAAADAVMVGSGNTFHLLREVATRGLLEPIRTAVAAGVPYIGWSAGTNLACPTIGTTNDMPIVEPPTLQALGLISFQINPHYSDDQLPDHAGETRTDRLMEFTTVHPHTPVVGLREGSLLLVSGDTITLEGKPARYFLGDREPTELPVGPVPMLRGRH